MTSHYKQRLQNHILEVLTDLLGRETRDPRVEGVVITAVELNEDLSVAKVFYMPPEGVGADDEAAKGLRRAASFLRGEIGRFLKTKTSPELRFQEDDSLDRFNRIETLLTEGDPQGPSEDSSAAGDD